MRLLTLLLVLACALPPARAADRYGDPLPDGALARLGTVRWRAGGPIALAAFLPDGKSLLTVSTDRVAQVWDRDTGKELRHFDAAGPTPTDPNAHRVVLLNGVGIGLALSGDGKTLACLGRDGEIHLWDVGAGKETAKINDVRAPGRAQLALSADGKVLVSSVYPQRTTVWDTTTGKEVRSFGEAKPDSRLMPYRAALSPDGKTLVQMGLDMGAAAAKGGSRFRLLVWDAGAGKELQRISDPNFGTGSAPAYLSALSPDAKMAAVPPGAPAPAGKKVKLIDLDSGKELHELDGYSDQGRLVFSPDGKLLVSLHAGGDGVTVWDTASGKKLRSVSVADAPAAGPAPLGQGAAALSVSADGKMLAWGDGPVVRLTDLETGKAKNGSAGLISAASELRFSREGQQLLTAGDDGTLRRWDAATGKELGAVVLPGRPYTSVIPSPDQRVLAACDTAGTIHFIDGATGKKKAFTTEQPGYGGAIVFSPDSCWLVTASLASPTVQVYDVAVGKAGRALTLPATLPDVAGGGLLLVGSGVPRRACFSPDGRLLAVTDGNLVLFDVAAARQERQIELPQGAMIRYATFSPDGRALAVEWNLGQVDVWEVASGQKRLALNAQPKPDPSRVNGGVAVGGRMVAASPVTLAFSPDGRLLAQADGNAARLWDLYTGKEVAAFEGHRGPIAGVAFAPDGRRLATSSTDTTALVWDADPAVKKLAGLAAPLAKEKLDAVWDALAESDGGRAYEAVRQLAGDPGQAVPYLAERVKPVSPPDATRVAKLIADLDADEFDARESARKELEKLGELALAPAREALKGRPSAEQRRSLEEVIQAGATPKLSGERLRLVRALEALEMAHTPEAVKVLKNVAAGAPGTLPTNQARTILTRLGVK
jgi:WD40 repeat protein